MPIKFNLEKIRKKYDCNNYFETGLYDPRRDNCSSNQALKCNFEKVYCIEILDKWVKLGKEVFKNEIKNKRYNLYLDDSTNLNKYLDDINFKDRTIFFLDAHVDNSNIKNYKLKCPLIEELNAIKNLKRKDNIILIDDLRILKKKNPWGEKNYGNINFIDEIKKIISNININYKFDTLDGHIKDDVLICYI